MARFTTSIIKFSAQKSRLAKTPWPCHACTVNCIQASHYNIYIPHTENYKAFKPRTEAVVRGQRSPRRTDSKYVSIQVPKKVLPSPPLLVQIGHSCSIIYEDPESVCTSPPPQSSISKPHWQKMKSHIQFLTTPTVDTNGTALMLNFDHQRYLIGNIHEGTQRACMERGAKLAKLSGIFLTGKTEWKNTGGLIGMILTIADVTQSGTEAIRAAIKEKVEKRALRLSRMTPKELAKQPNYDYVPPKKPEKHTMTIHGGPNITHTLATARRFIFRKGTPIDVDEFTELDEEHREESTWSDRHIRVWTMSIDPSTNKDPVTHKSPQSSRKRSFDEYKENDHLQKDRSLVEEADRNQQLRRAVVCDMFDSDWRLDALVETPISQVNMPATLFVRNPETKAIEKYSGPLPGSGESLPDLNVLVRKPWPGTLIADLPPTRPSEASLSYIIRNHPQRGKFILQKAKELNVDVRHFKDLAEGKTVTSLDGKEVLPEQVLEKGKPGTGFAIIDLPSTEYVQGLVNRSEWKVDDIMTGVEMMIWILGPGVGQDPALRKFMIDFSHLKHIVSSQDHCPNSLTMDSCSAATIRRNQIDPDRYSVPIHSNSPSRKEDGDVGLYSVPETITASRGLTIDLEPFLVIKEETSVQPLNTAEILKESGRDVKLLAKVIGQDIASEKVQTELENQNLPSPEAEMIFLGTGSAMPSKYRNVSATLLRVPGSGSYLLDCGENTLGQLSRVYTSDELLEVLRDLKMIWISHLHADHHLGIASVIKAWYQAVYGKDYKPEDSADVTHRERCSNPVKTISEQKRLFVASDDAMLHWLAEYASVEDFGYAKLIPLKVVAARPHAPDSTELYWEEIPLDFKQTDTELLVHR